MKLKRGISAWLALLMCAAILTACGSTTETVQPNEAQSNGEKYTLKMHFTVSSTDPVGMAGAYFAEKVSEATNDNVTVELYPSSSLGATNDCLEGLSMQACDIVLDSLGTLASVSDLCNIDAVPYMYSGMDHYRAVWEGEVGKKILKDISDTTSITILGGGIQGVRITTATMPIRSVEDVKGFKLRVPTIPIYLDTWEWLGAAPTPLSASELFTAIQQGTVDGQENPYSSSVSLSIHEVCDYVIETNHVYCTTVFAMDTNYLNSMPADYREAIQTAAQEAGVYLTDLVEETVEQYKQTFIDAGAEIIEVDFDEWQTAFDGFLEEKYPYLEEYAQMIRDADPST